MLAILASGARALCLVVTLRALPFVGYALLSRRVPLRGKVMAVALYALVVALLSYLDTLASFGWIAAGMAYYTLLGWGMNRLCRLLSDETFSRGGLFVLLVVVCLFLPGVVLPGIAGAMFLVIGWEMLLSGYSYCVENAGRAALPSLGERLFFLLVNPTLTWTRRGEPISEGSPKSPGLSRAALGLLVMGANAVLLRPMHRALLADGFRLGWPGGGALLGAVLYGLLRILSEYASHSGLAHIQIGLMRQIGWAVPERYDYPLLARSPMDFWRRWNTYVRVWLEAYVLWPAAARMIRARRGRVGLVLVTFWVLLASGLLHDGYTFASRLALSTHTTRMFLLVGVLAVVWRIAGAVSDALRARLRAPAGGWLDTTTMIIGRASAAACFVTAGVFWW